MFKHYLPLPVGSHDVRRTGEVDGGAVAGEGEAPGPLPPDEGVHPHLSGSEDSLQD